MIMRQREPSHHYCAHPLSSIFLHTCLAACLPAYLFSCFNNWLIVCLFGYLSFCLPACLSTYLLTTYLHTHLLACLSACLLFCILNLFLRLPTHLYACLSSWPLAYLQVHFPHCLLAHQHAFPSHPDHHITVPHPLITPPTFYSSCLSNLI